VHTELKTPQKGWEHLFSSFLSIPDAWQLHFCPRKKGSLELVFLFYQKDTFVVRKERQNREKMA
jgi:hypothetical protein